MKKYLQISTSVLADIQRGVYAAGDQLPTEMELAATYQVSRQSIRQALGVLERDGLIQKIRGSGSYVSHRQIPLPQTMRIAVLVASIDSCLIPGILSGIEHVCSQNHYSIQLMSTNNSVAKERSILQDLLFHAVDGVLAEGTKSALPNPNVSLYRELAARNIPIVFFNSSYPELLNGTTDRILTVTMDDYGGAFEATMSLIRDGHCSIGGVFTSDDLPGVRRYSGFLDALAQSHLGLEDQHALLLSGSDAASRLNPGAILKLATECTAILCQSNEIAEQILTFSRTFAGNASIVVLVCDAPASNDSGIHIRSYVHPKEKLGQIAAEKVISMLNGVPEESIVLPWIASI